jgi:hypothetical protein
MHAKRLLIVVNISMKFHKKFSMGEGDMLRTNIGCYYTTNFPNGRIIYI